MENFIELLYARFLLSEGVSIDTRTLKPGNLFFGLRGPNFNGSQYAEKALEMGAAYAVVDDSTFHKHSDNRYIFCEDSLKALQELAVFHRSKFKRPVVALTGSNGKTTTKELINAVLSKKYITSATRGNLNNHIGVPLSLLDIYPQVEIAIIEMGANHVGEIATLSAMAQPTHGLITNIGHAHTELFGGIEGVLRGKTELYDFLGKSHGKAFINQNDERLKHMTHRFESPIVYPESDVLIAATKPTLTIKIGDEEVSTQMFGSYNFQNVAAAIAIGRHFEVPEKDIASAIRSYQPENMRSQIIQKGGVRLILDAYNANPDSMKAALENLTNESGKKLAILGDMFEIEDVIEQHQAVGNYLKGFDEVDCVFVGKRMKHAYDVCPGSSWYESAAEASQALSSRNFKGTTVLLKASRSMRLETLKDVILK